MVEFFAILLPVAAASGWWAAKRSLGTTRVGARPYDVDPAYFRGLNYLVNEQPDKAIDIFVRMLEVNSETVELHLTLGNLFRRRGEVDRAIRIHQNLIARPTLSRPQRAQALLELGRDYLRAGLLDRAEGLFNELVELGQQVRPALKNLIVVYQHEKDWEKCLEASRKLVELGDRAQRREQAHYYCELAEEAIGAANTGQAADLLEKARATDPTGPRPLLMQAELARSTAHYDEAIGLYQRVGAQQPIYADEVVEPLARCFEALGQFEQWQLYLREQYERRPSLPVMLAIAEDIQRDDGDAAALVFVSRHLEASPSLRGLERLIDLRLGELGAGRAEFVALLHDLVGRLAAGIPSYRCHRCGFSARTLHWQCPGCRGWGTMHPYPSSNNKESP
ncbi:MAG: lipopolysaccharide assembly protein LapB [Pseudomonadota bacterium]